jgi:hypothetical protein
VKTLIWWNRLAFFLFILGAVILAFGFTLQPKISDDLYLLWGFQNSSDTVGWLIKEYKEVTGRIWVILLTTFVSPHPFPENIYRAFIVVEIALLGALAWYCARGRDAWHRTVHNVQAMTIFATLLWFALPARNETVAWLIGNFAYFVPALFGLAFIAWLEHSMVTPGGESNVSRHLASDILSFLLGICAGVSHEQVVAACVTYLALVIFPVSRRLLLERPDVGRRVWIGAVGLMIGAAVLVSAPGNYVRTTYVVAPGLNELVERMVLYLSGAYFDMGTDTTGKSIWLGALVFVLLFFNRNASKREIAEGLKRGVFWCLISVATLLAMAPATNFISTRTTLFAVIFLYVGVAAATCRAQSLSGRGEAPQGQTKMERTEPRLIQSTAVLTILGCLFVVESVATLISNVSVAAEVANREEIVKKATLSNTTDDKSSIRVPFIATQAAALTYIQNPQHDTEFLLKWGKAVGRTIEHDASNAGPLPDSLNPLKAIKFRHKD